MNPESPTFSFILPAYNIAPWIAASLESLLVQSETDWECICADDGSTDDTLAILQDFARRDSRIRVLKLNHGGVSAARNAALDLARGQWIGFLDGDDLLAPCLLAASRQALQTVPDADMIAFDVETFFGDAPAFPTLADLGPIRAREIKPRLGIPTLGFFFYARLYRRDLLNNLRFRDFAPSEDYVLLAEATCRATRQAVIPARLYGYRTRPGSQVNSPMTLKRIVHLLEAVHAICDTFTASTLQIEPPLARSLANDAAERFTREYTRLPPADRPAARAALHTHYPFFAAVPWFSAFQRLRFRILNALPCIPAFTLLCRLPESLKRVGLHRPRSTR